MKLDLSTFKVTDLDGKSYDIPDMGKQLGNELYKSCSTIEQEDLARAIHKGEAFDISEQDLDLLIQFLEQKQLFVRWIQSQLTKHLTSLKPTSVEAEEIKG